MVKSFRKQGETVGRNAATIRVAQSTYQKAVLKKLLTQVLLAFLVLFVVYLCFAATIIRFVPAAGGPVLIKNNTYPGGTLPAGANVLIDLNPSVTVEDGVLPRLQQSFVPQKNTAVVEVLGGPTGKLNWVEPGVLTVDGKALDVPFPQPPGFDFLAATNQDGSPGLEYVAVCLKGACVPGTPVFFRTENVYGVPVSKESFDSTPDWERLKDAERERPAGEAVAAFLRESGKVSNGKQASCAGKALVQDESISDDLLARGVNNPTSLKGVEADTLNRKVQAAVKACKSAGGKR